MRIRKPFLIIAIFVSMLSLGCVTFIVETDWLAEVPFEKGVVQMFLGQEKLYSGGTYPHEGKLLVKLNSIDKISNVKLIDSDVKLSFLKEGVFVRELNLFPIFPIVNNNTISWSITTYDKHTYVSPKIIDKEYTLNWDEFMKATEESDSIKCRILMKFEANGQQFFVQKEGELIKDIKRDVFFGMYE